MRLLAIVLAVALPGCSTNHCDAVSCPTGCCSADGFCLAGSATAFCGKGGQLCVQCPLLKVCGADQSCGTCGADNCPGCCNGGSCEFSSNADGTCGQMGAACVDCTKTSQGCNGSTFACEGGPEPLGEDGGVVPLNIAVANLYADSIFTLDITVNAPDGGAVEVAGAVPFGTADHVLNAFRIAGQKIEKRPAELLIDPRSQLAIAASVVSLGETHGFTATTSLDEATLTKNTLEFAYDFDVALGKFTLRYGWVHLP